MSKRRIIVKFSKKGEASVRGYGYFSCGIPGRGKSHSVKSKSTADARTMELLSEVAKKHLVRVNIHDPNIHALIRYARLVGYSEGYAEAKNYIRKVLAKGRII